ncbi:hypothetical protein GU926_11395 [Nibribacter ruber]|uniref:Erythromycin esterase family protein n=1 Tax=Nibribacter ruber TaxID=2698458 RepID=A0A6P1P057_9BACT|nr:erythromycin esterase family protein [Nibribacter ruber]QHL87999.1 hypothetical protein GU926_11395 [Nibribacter ruber]
MKKALKRIALFVVLTPVVLVVLAAVGYFSYRLVAVGGESTPHQAYLAKYKEEITPAQDPAFSIFDSAFYQNQIFFLGEAHGTAKPQELDFALVKHLNQKVNMRYYLAEVDYSQAHYLNQYLLTGDEKNLDVVFQFWARLNAQWGNQDFMNKIKKIRAYNQILPEAQRVSIMGVDRIQDPEALHRHLKELVATLPASQNPLQNSLRLLTSSDSLDTDALTSLAKQLITKDSASLGFELRHTLQNAVYYTDRTKRDSVMYLNLNTLVQSKGLQKEKFYGMWGMFHAIPVQVERGTPFAYLLQHASSPFKNKAVSIGVYTLDSESMMPTATMPSFVSKGQRFVNTTMSNNDGPLVFVNGIKDLRAVTKENSMTLFKTNAPGTPYKNSERLASFKVLMPNQSIAFKQANTGLADVFQYICLVRNSRATTPVELKQL